MRIRPATRVPAFSKPLASAGQCTCAGIPHDRKWRTGNVSPTRCLLSSKHDCRLYDRYEGAKPTLCREPNGRVGDPELDEIDFLATATELGISMTIATLLSTKIK
jgi:hypothetical protein